MKKILFFLLSGYLTLFPMNSLDSYRDSQKIRQRCPTPAQCCACLIPPAYFCIAAVLRWYASHNLDNVGDEGAPCSYIKRQFFYNDLGLGLYVGGAICSVCYCCQMLMKFCKCRRAHAE